VSSGKLCLSKPWSVGCAGTCAFGISLLKDTYNLGFQFREFHGEDDSLRMKYQIASCGQQTCVLAQNLAHPPLDPVAFMRLTQHFSGSEPHARH